VLTPDEVFDGDQALGRFARAFERLSPKKREAFVLVTLEGLSGEAAATVQAQAVRLTTQP